MSPLVFNYPGCVNDVYPINICLYQVIIMVHGDGHLIDWFTPLYHCYQPVAGAHFEWLTSQGFPGSLIRSLQDTKNSKELSLTLDRLEVPPEQKLVSYVTDPFTIVLVDKTLDIIGEKLLDDPAFHSRSRLEVTQVIQLLQFCLNTT